ncbi:CbtA family protein [Marmoricola sp. RAF53]|uniref:CbtA family protein n=1 Tax=Marmoricola sp. RAF53 TaxID=3233059 RepID=UPI003F9ACA5A
MNARTFLIHGLLAGLLAGFAAFLVAHQIGEPPVDAAIALEEAGGAAGHTHDAGGPADHHHDADETVVSRQNQSTWGLLTGTLAIGTALGGLVGLAAAAAAGRFGRARIGQTTALVALVGFVAVALVPFLKYPATPPAVGNAETIGHRTGVYFTFLAISVLAAVVATVVASRLLPALGTYRTVLVTAGGYLLVVAVTAALMPAVNEIGDFPAATLWEFRRASITTLATLWGVLGLVLVGLVGRTETQVAVANARRELAASL